MITWGLTRDRKEAIVGVLMLLPIAAIIAVVIIFPLIRACMVSFTNTYWLQPRDQDRYVGLENYVWFLQNPKLLLYVKNTTIWVCGTLIGILVLGMILALLLSRQIRFRGLYRGLALVPLLMPNAATAIVWRWIFDGQWGILNYILTRLHVIDSYICWLVDPKYAWFAILMVSIWKHLPFMFVNLLAGLQVIPVELYDAGKVDGTTSWTAFRYITLPQLRGVLSVMILLEIIWLTNEAVLIWILTKGGPIDISMAVAPLVYATAFEYFRIGRASAIGTFLMLCTLVLVGMYLKRVEIDI